MEFRGKQWASACLIFGLLSVVMSSAFAAEPTLENWIKTQTARSLDQIERSISPSDGAIGSVMASPSRSNPNYYFYWVRDAAIVMREVWAFRTLNPGYARNTLKDYALFSKRNQATDNRSGYAYDLGLGEPKFEMSGAPYEADWGRPQNDGPALRVLALLGLADDLMRSGETEFVYRNLYTPALPARTVIKADLEFVAHHWSDPSFDLWEEVKGDHFYTRIVQWRALEEGAAFAKKMGDPEAARFYSAQAVRVQDSLDHFWSTSRDYLVATRNWVGGHAPEEKPSLLDVAVLLGALHAGKSGSPFYVDDDRVIATMDALTKTFADTYSINRRSRNEDGLEMAPGIGRYSEDRYDGYSSEGLGNPWFLATHAMAEALLRLRGELASRGEVRITVLSEPFFSDLVGQPLIRGGRVYGDDPLFKTILRALETRSDAFIRRAQFHSGEGGHQSEQFNRDHGEMQGARDLTWSYASFLSLRRIREQAYGGF